MIRWGESRFGCIDDGRIYNDLLDALAKYGRNCCDCMYLEVLSAIPIRTLKDKVWDTVWEELLLVATRQPSVSTMAIGVEFALDPRDCKPSEDKSTIISCANVRGYDMAYMCKLSSVSYQPKMKPSSKQSSNPGLNPRRRPDQKISGLTFVPGLRFHRCWIEPSSVTS